MTDPEKLAALAERCEALSGPDREVDVALWRLHPAYQHKLSRASGLFPRGADKEEYERKWALANAPAYTASLDAAMTLAADFGGQVTFFKDGTAKAFLWQPYPLAIEVKAATAALALAACALRARALAKESDNANG